MECKPLYKSLWAIMLMLLPLGTGAKAEPAEATFKAGMILPLSGPLAEYGNAFKNGVTMAAADFPALFSGITLLYEDSQYDSKTAVSAFEKLRQEKVSLIFVWGNGPSEAVCPLSERYGLPTLASVSNPSVSRKKQYVIRSVNHSVVFARILAEYLREKNLFKIGVVLTEISYLSSLLTDLQKALAPNQQIEIIGRYGPGETDFRASVTKARHNNYDAIGVFLMSGQISQFYRQAAEQKLSTPTFGTDFFESTTEIDQAHGTMDGAVYAHFDVDQDFRQRYLETFGNDIQLTYAGNGYDMSLLIAKTASSAPKTAAAIMELLRQKEQQKGVEGAFRYRETEEGGSYFEFPVHIKQIRGKKFEIVKTR